MSGKLEEQIISYFNTPLRTGETRKIVYLFDENRSYEERILALKEETGVFELIKVDDHHFFYAQYQLEKVKTENPLLLYFAMPPVTLEENPLADVLLYSQELKVDPESQLLLSLGIKESNSDMKEVLKKYPTFFRSKERLNRCRKYFDESIKRDAEALEWSILATLFRAFSSYWTDVFIALFEDAYLGQGERLEVMQKFGNEKRFWEIVEEYFGYEKQESEEDIYAIKDLGARLFMTNLSAELGEVLPRKLFASALLQANHAVVFVNQWMNARDKHQSYKVIADMIEKRMTLTSSFHDMASEQLALSETFRWFDEAFIHRMIKRIIEGERREEHYENLLAQRRNTFWYSDYKQIYHTVKWTLKLTKSIRAFNEQADSLTTATKMWEAYGEEFYKIDQAYRKFYFYYDQLSSEWQEDMRGLERLVEAVYTKDFLDLFNRKWDQLFSESFSVSDSRQQSNFYRNEVLPFASKDRRVFVIISDALRYEAGKEYFLRLIEEKRYNGEIGWMKTELPSTTAAGMAALLPHSQLDIDSNGNVSIEGLSTNGVRNRDRILKQFGHEQSMAIQANHLLDWTQAELREKVAGQKVIYIYHNRIDAIGDHRLTEDDVFAATEETFVQLKRLMDRLATEVSANQILVTADHGYLYTRAPINKTEKVMVEGVEEAGIKNKRFILSSDPLDSLNAMPFRLSEKWHEEGYITIPRGRNRFALAGGGYQYVHGGHSPQEMMVPLLRIKTDRGRNEMQEVSVILVSQTRMITNNIVWLDFLQKEPISEEKKEKQLMLYFEDTFGNKLSNEVRLIADSDNESSERRVIREKFVLLNGNYSSEENYYFVMENANDANEVIKEKFRIDLI